MTKHLATVIGILTYGSKSAAFARRSYCYTEVSCESSSEPLMKFELEIFRWV